MPDIDNKGTGRGTHGYPSCKGIQVDSDEVSWHPLKIQVGY